MIHPATREVADACQTIGMAYEIEERGSDSLVIALLKLKYTNVHMCFISSDDDNDVALRIFRFVSLPQSRAHARARLLEAVNCVNGQYRFVKFFLDSDNDVSVMLDYPVSTENVNRLTLECIIRTRNILDSAHSIFMKAIWSTEDFTIDEDDNDDDDIDDDDGDE